LARIVQYIQASYPLHPDNVINTAYQIQRGIRLTFPLDASMLCHVLLITITTITTIIATIIATVVATIVAIILIISAIAIVLPPIAL